MPYTAPIDIDTFYTSDDLAWYAEHFGGTPWAVHIIGPDEIHTHWDPELPEDDPANLEFTQRTALKWASDHNAWRKKFDKDNDGRYQDIATHCVVLHNGVPWVPNATDGPADEYCEWFDFESFDWFCNQCFNVLKDTGAHCPTCAPTRFPGLMRVPCDDESNRHPAIFMFADNTDGYSGAYCQFCIAEHQREVAAQDEQLVLERMHARHGAWRHWRLTGWLLKSGRRMGLVAGYTTYHAEPCLGCVYDIHWKWTR